MLRNQFVIYKENTNYLSFSECMIKKFVGLDVIYNHKLSCTIVNINQIRILLLGYILDPFNPGLSNEQIINSLCKCSADTESLINNLQKYSGRYVLLYKSNDDFIALTDALGLKQLYYTNNEDDIIISSSPKLMLDLLNWQPEISDEVKNLLISDDYKLNESPWVSEYWYDKRIKRVLPNHYFDLIRDQVYRTPLFITQLSEKETCELAKTIFTGSLRAVSNRFEKILQPLTAGWDSRLLLAASKSLSNNIEYYLFINNPQELEKSDVIIATKLASKLNLNFKIVSTVELKKEFMEKYSEICIFPRILPKTSNIQWHYYENSDKNVININGNGGEILRRVYYYYERKDGKVDIKTLLKCRVYNWFFESEIENWYRETSHYAEKYNISLLDLFYWEQRIGQWHALYQYEQDVAIEEFSPFNNKSLLLSILQIDPEKRMKSNCIFCKEIILELLPEALDEPLNPIFGLNLKRRIIVYLRKKPDLFLFLKKIKKSVIIKQAKMKLKL